MWYGRGGGGTGVSSWPNCLQKRRKLDARQDNHLNINKSHPPPTQMTPSAEVSQPLCGTGRTFQTLDFSTRHSVDLQIVILSAPYPQSRWWNSPDKVRSGHWTTLRPHAVVLIRKNQDCLTALVLSTLSTKCLDFIVCRSGAEQLVLFCLRQQKKAQHKMDNHLNECGKLVKERLMSSHI